MISDLVTERQERNTAAVTEVASKWGEVQSITGPALVVPYTQRWTDESGDRPVTPHHEKDRDRPARATDDARDNEIRDPATRHLRRTRVQARASRRGRVRASTSRRAWRVA